jgi:hypothetical protein
MMKRRYLQLRSHQDSKVTVIAPRMNMELKRRLMKTLPFGPTSSNAVKESLVEEVPYLLTQYLVYSYYAGSGYDFGTVQTSVCMNIIIYVCIESRCLNTSFAKFGTRWH